MTSANIIEIFSSIQGEGKYVGTRQIFVRFADCNLRCEYCDTDFSRREFCNIETNAGEMKFKQVSNPLTVEQTIAIINELSNQVPIHSISFTGGEPLLQYKFIKDAAERLNHKIFLETNGTLINELREIINFVDLISMDIKLERGLFDRHREFIKVATAKDLYIKIVLTGEITKTEFITAVEMINSVDKNILLILQPVTPVNGVKPINAKQLLNFQALALKYLNEVRVIPQLHKLIHVF